MRKSLPWLAALALLALSALTLFGVAMSRPLNHDEHQFIASGALVGLHGLLPYRDFPFFHTPLQPFVYGALFRFTDHLLLAGRVFSTALMSLAGGVVFLAAWRLFKGWGEIVRIGLATAAGLAFLANPLIVYTACRAWNHSLPLLLLLLAILAHARAVASKQDAWFALGGCLIALAAATRISYAPLALPFLILSMSGGTGGMAVRIRRVLWCGGGMALGSLPVLVVMLQAPQSFFFDVFAYNGSINSQYRVLGEGRTHLGWQKITFALRMLVQPACLALAALLGWVIWRLRRDRVRLPYLLWSSGVLLPFVLLGVFAASPSFSQYYTPLVPLFLLAIAGGLAALPPGRRGACGAAFALASLAAVLSSVGHLGSLRHLGSPQEWVPMRIHQAGLKLRQYVPEGRILTLAPIVPLEGGLSIYPEFVSGPFGWRTAPYVNAQDKARFDIAGEAELPALLAATPPDGVFTGYERKDERPMKLWAQSHGFSKIPLGKKKDLWVPGKK